MPRLPDRRLRLTELGGWLRDAYPDASVFPSYWQLRAASYAGIYRTEVDGRRVYIAPDQVGRIVQHFKLDHVLTPLAEVAD